MDKTEWQLFLEDVDEALKDNKNYKRQKQHFLKPAENCINDLFNKAKETANSKNEFIKILLGNSPKIKQNNALLYSNNLEKQEIKGFSKIKNKSKNSETKHIKFIKEKLNNPDIKIDQHGISKTNIKTSNSNKLYRLFCSYYICRKSSNDKNSCYVFLFPLDYINVKK